MWGWACRIFARRAHLSTAHAGRRARRTRQRAGDRAHPDHQSDHYAVRIAAAQDYQAFYEKELAFRRMMRYPPFSAMANVLVRSEKQEMAMRLSSELAILLTPPPESSGSWGGEAPVARVKNEYATSF